MSKSTLAWMFAAVLAIAAAAGAGASYCLQGHARDQVAIEDLLSRYSFALDWQDPQLYASMFTEDGVLVWAGGTVNGRPAIVEMMRKARAADEHAATGSAPLRPARRRHFLSNIALRISGDRATARSYWFELNDDNPERHPYVGAYGHLEDELRRVEGQWQIARHQVFNEQRAEMAAPATNPAW